MPFFYNWIFWTISSHWFPVKYFWNRFFIAYTTLQSSFDYYDPLEELLQFRLKCPTFLELKHFGRLLSMSFYKNIYETDPSLEYFSFRFVIAFINCMLRSYS